MTLLNIKNNSLYKNLFSIKITFLKNYFPEMEISKMNSGSVQNYFRLYLRL